jgi:hypothetical protein
LRSFCLAQEAKIRELPLTWETERRSPTSSRYGSYNFLMLKSPVTKRVYDLIHTAYDELIEHEGIERESLWIQSWLNIHRPGEGLDVHRHQGFRANGFFTVDPCGTTTTFEVGDSELPMPGVPGRLTLVGRDDVWHRISPFEGDAIRVTIAFDLLCGSDIEAVGERVFFPFS